MSISLKLKTSKKKQNRRTDNANPENLEYVSEISTETSTKREKHKWSEGQFNKQNWHLNKGISFEDVLSSLPDPPTLEDYKKCTINDFATKYKALLTHDIDTPSKRQK